MNVPSTLPRLARTATSSTLNSGILNISPKVSTLSDFLKLCGDGGRCFASISPANQPAAIKGFNDVSQATVNVVSIDFGYPLARAAPAALSMPFIIIQ